MKQIQILKSVLNESIRLKQQNVCKPVLYDYEVKYIIDCINKVNQQQKAWHAFKNLFKISAGAIGCYLFLVFTIIILG